MSSRLRRLIPALLVLYLAGMLAAFVWINYGQGLPDEIKRLPEEIRSQTPFAVEWLTAETIVLFIQLFMSLHCTAVILAFSLFPSTGESGGGPADFARMIRGPLAVFLVLTLGHAVLCEFVLPGRQSAGEAARNRAVLATSLYTRGRQAEKAGEADPSRLVESRLYFVNLKRLLPRSSLVQETLNRLDARINERRAGLAVAAKKTGGEKPPLLLNQSKQDLVGRAEFYRKQGDYSSVLFYAGLAVKLDAKNPAARALLEEARKRLDRYGETPDEQRRRRLAQLKVLAIGSYEEMGRSGNYDPDKVFESYRTFFKLSAEFPEDADLKNYLADNRTRLAESHFFFEELPLVADFSAAGAGGAFFLNPVASLPAGQRELICFRQLVHTENSGPDGLAYGTFLIDLEVMRQDANGALRSHFRVPYARFREIEEKQERFLQLKCVSRDSPQDKSRMNAPVAVPGSPPAALPAALMPIAFNEEELGRLAMAAGWSTQAGISALMEGMQVYRRAGYPEGRMQEALLQRIARLFNLLVFSFLALALGWKLRSRYLTVPGLAAAVSLVLLPPVVFVVLEGWGFLFSLVVGFALHAWGLPAGVAALALLEVFLFAGALLFLAARFNDG
jgi:hypothetical protein